jgi:glyoxylase-like metal-dependent hydrolase (beta-lactamase superfamily II)
VYSDLPDPLSASSAPGSLPKISSSPKPPQAVQDNIFAFPPNRDILGGTSYLIVGEVNILIDCPAWNQANENFLRSLGGVELLFLTHRGGIGKAQEVQEVFGCEIVIQEQEAYLLPRLKVATFQHEFTLSSLLQAIWTPGHSPGSSCLYYINKDSHLLFSGRHLLPNRLGEPVPLRTAKTFHWPRQIKSVQLLRDRFTPETLQYICPGANIGFLRGNRAIAQAYQQLASLDLEALLQTKPIF